MKFSAFLAYFGIDPIAIQPAAQSAVKSIFFTGQAVIVGFFGAAVMAATNADPITHAAHGFAYIPQWMGENWQPFLMIQIAAPLARWIVGLNHYTPSSLTPEEPGLNHVVCTTEVK